MNRQRTALQHNTLGLQPEQVLVLETVGPVQNFLRAVKRIAGLEWLGEFEIEDIPPEDGFADERDSEKHLGGQLFLVMTDQRALRELAGLFRAWQRRPERPFSRGLTPWQHAFAHLRNIRPWDATDRIRDTGIKEDWLTRIANNQQVLPFEAELWFRENTERRQQGEGYLRDLVNGLGGEVVQQCTIPEIRYHGLLGRIPSSGAQAILESREVRLLQCEDICYMRPVGQFAVRLPESTDTQEPLGAQRAGTEPPQGAPVVALFDGMPLARHRLLDGRLMLDDPDGFEGSYQAAERIHGTAIASLICQGDLTSGGFPLSRPVYVRPIMKPHRDFDGSCIELIPEDVLPVDIIHRAVRRLFVAGGEGPPTAGETRVVNLSVCNRARPFDREMSSLARLLDWLSYQYNVLFVVSAGNHPQDIALAVASADLHSLSPQDTEKAILRAVAADTRHRRLLSPAEALNSLTLGASHADASTAALAARDIDPFSLACAPSPISAHGPGYRRSIKPEILLPGGRQLLREKLGGVRSSTTLEVVNSSRAPGCQVATPGPAGQLDRTMYTRGTSNAAALASRGAALLFDVLENLRTRHGTALPVEYDAVLLKTLLVHGADWGEAGPLYESVLRTPDNSRTIRETLARFLGYGMIDLARVMDCTDQRVTVLGVGALGDGEAHEFRLPLPPSLSAETEKRRLAITLAWFSPVNCLRQNYRVAHLWFDSQNALATNRMCAGVNAASRGTVQHDVLQGTEAVDFQDGDAVVIKVSCRADAGDILAPVRYGLAVTLEVAEGVAIPIYEEVADRLRVRVPVAGGRPRAAHRPG